jgi:hypothetical protein
VSLAHPHYNSDEELFTKLLDRLGELNDEWASDLYEPFSFSQLDFINGGDFDKWRRYNNSIRLKAALLVSTQGPLATKGQAVIAEILNNSSAHPIIDNPQYDVVMAQVPTAGSMLDINGGSGFDWVNQRMAGAELIKRMQKAGDGGVWLGKGTKSIAGEESAVDTTTTDDPRLPIMFCLATEHGEFAAVEDKEVEVKTDTVKSKVDATRDSTDINGNVVLTYKNGKAIPSIFRGSCASTDPDVWVEYLYPSANRAYYSYIRPNGFFKDNRNWDNPIITSAEVNFIKAEAYQRSWATGNAQDAFKQAVEESIQLYFKYQKNRSHTEASLSISTSSTSRSFACVINPDEATYNDGWIESFASARWTSRIDGSSYEGGNLEAILDQKWLHYGYMYATEQWSDLRRTGYPTMTYLRDTGYPNEDAMWPISKMKYPDSERNNNANFLSEIQSKGKDDWYYQLFWAKDKWYTPKEKAK